MTESGVGHSLQRLAPEKKFYFLPNENCNCSECPYMRRNTLEKLRDALKNLAQTKTVGSRDGNERRQIISVLVLGNIVVKSVGQVT